MNLKGGKALVGLLLVAVAALLPSVAAANPVYTVGPGDTYPGTALDTAGQWRINVERDPVFLPAGRYAVLDFAMNTGNAAGYVTPFLAIGLPSIPPAHSTYTVLWVGNQFDPAASGIQTDSYLPGTEEFILAAGGNVYAGFYQSNALVYLNTSGGNTDHDNSPVEPTYVGDTVADFSHENLPRTYAFEVNVGYIPEPATLSLLALGGLALLRRRRRNG